MCLEITVPLVEGAAPLACNEFWGSKPEISDFPNTDWVLHSINFYVRYETKYAMTLKAVRTYGVATIAQKLASHVSTFKGLAYF
jgi:hypothetical protein